MQCSKNKTCFGFSMIEILIVISIICVLIGLLVPVLQNARNSGLRAVAVSNMHQTTAALLIYEQDWGDLPLLDTARKSVPVSATCDPKDYWRKNCTGKEWGPMLGSFAYVRGLKIGIDESSWQAFRQHSPTTTLLISIFQAEERVEPFDGDWATCAVPAECAKYRWPTILLFARADGSVKSQSKSYGTAKSFRLISWPIMFMSDRGHFSYEY